MNMKFDVLDPVKFAEIFWPHIYFYDKQKEIMYSVRDNYETVVVAGNMLGKDFVSGYLALWFFLSRQPCRILTTSADHYQLKTVLWGELGRFIQTSKYPLLAEKGGLLIVNDLFIRKLDPETGEVCKISYLMGRTAAKGEGMLGHHVADVGDGIPRTFFLCDEGSGVEDVANERAETWCARKLIIGNPYPCTNFFYRAVKGGDVLAQEMANG